MVGGGIALFLLVPAAGYALVPRDRMQVAIAPMPGGAVLGLSETF